MPRDRIRSGSWEHAFNRTTHSVCADPVTIVHGENDRGCVPFRGSATSAVEAAATFEPRRIR